jgi:dihydroorotate dehydrogenase (fumarate)
MDLSTTYLNLRLKHPFVLGASPLTGNLDNVRRLEDGGCAAIVMHSLFEEQIAPGPPAGAMPELDRAIPAFVGSFAEFLLADQFPLRPGEYLEQIRRIKAAVSVPVIGSLNGTGLDGWLEYGRLIEQAGADAIELNVYRLAGRAENSPVEIEQRTETLVRTLRGMVRVPVAVKISPFYTALAGFGARLVASGADGLVLFNRVYEPDIDVESAEMLPNLRLSTSEELPLRLRWLAALSGRLPAALAVTGGVHTVVDGVKALLCGADAVQMVSAVLQQGPAHFGVMERGLRYWMDKHKHESLAAFQGRLSLAHVADPGDFERMAYLRILQSWRHAIPVQPPGFPPG